MKTLCFLAILGLAFSLPTKELYFRDDYTLLNELGAFYKIHKAKVDFSTAVSTCSAEGAVLFVPSCSDEIRSVFSLMPDISSTWIGIHDLYGEGFFVTIEGEYMDRVFSNWAAGEPNNVHGHENCVAANKDTTYNDIACNSARFFVCKKRLDTLTHNVDCQTHDLAYVLSSKIGKCYKLHVRPSSWNEAYRTCTHEGSSLVVINSQSEANFLVELLKRYPVKDLPGSFDKNRVHVGFNDIINHGVYLTIEGKPLSETGYHKWARGQPDNNKDNEHCGSMFRNGELSDVDCKTKAMFICERSLITFGGLDIRKL